MKGYINSLMGVCGKLISRVAQWLLIQWRLLTLRQGKSDTSREAQKSASSKETLQKSVPKSNTTQSKNGWTPKIKRIKKCLQTGKIMYTREEAVKNRDQQKVRTANDYLRIYCCEFCANWHLTHKRR